LKKDNVTEGQSMTTETKIIGFSQLKRKRLAHGHIFRRLL
jgi:hypothetical protein